MNNILEHATAKMEEWDKNVSKFVKPGSMVLAAYKIVQLVPSINHATTKLEVNTFLQS